MSDLLPFSESREWLEQQFNGQQRLLNSLANQVYEDNKRLHTRVENTLKVVLEMEERIKKLEESIELSRDAYAALRSRLDKFKNGGHYD